MSFELRINDDAFAIDSVDELQEKLVRVRQVLFSEVWLIPTQRWPTLTMLVNGNSAWLMFMRYEGDAGFSTRNPKYTGPATAVIEFYLSNGQRDEYPAAFDIGTGEALKGMEYFFSNQERAPWLTWHDDG